MKTFNVADTKTVQMSLFRLRARFPSVARCDNCGRAGGLSVGLIVIGQRWSYQFEDVVEVLECRWCRGAQTRELKRRSEG